MKHLQPTTDIVRAYVANNPMPVNALPEFIAAVHAALSQTGRPAAPVVEAPRPAVNPKRSVHRDYIICLEDGKKFKTLRRHLMTHFGMTPEEYRAKWDLPIDYPMVAPGYSAERTMLAKQSGLGKRRLKSTAKAKPAAKRRQPR